MRYKKGGMRTGIMSDIQVVNQSKTARHNGETYSQTRLHLNFYQDKFITLVRRTLEIREILHSSFGTLQTIGSLMWLNTWPICSIFFASPPVNRTMRYSGTKTATPPKINRLSMRIFASRRLCLLRRRLFIFSTVTAELPPANPTYPRYSSATGKSIRRLPRWNL